MAVVVESQVDVGSHGSGVDGLRALVLLGGTVLTGQLSTRTGRPIFDLPLEADKTILDHWRCEALTLRALNGGSDVPVRVMINRNAPERSNGGNGGHGHDGLAPIRVERDPFDYRGTGGVLRDLAAEFADEDLLLVANAAQVLTEPLAAIAVELAQAGGDVSLISHLDGTPSGLMLVRCQALRGLPATGFVDMKEQALPLISRNYDVTVVHRHQPTGLPVRTLDNYIEALRTHHKSMQGKATGGAFAEDWEPTFVIVENGARVDPAARLHDAVVLSGGLVEADACAVHSIVCAGGVLRRSQMVVDNFVTAGENGRARN